MFRKTNTVVPETGWYIPIANPTHPHYFLKDERFPQYFNRDCVWSTTK